MQTDSPEEKASGTAEEFDEGPVENRTSNVIAATMTIALAGVILVQSQFIGEPGRPTDPGPGGYPTLLAVILIVVAIPLFFQKESGETWPSFKRGLGAVAMLVGMFVYAQILGLFGYIIPTIALILFGIKVADPKTSWVRSILYAVVFSVIIFYVFYSILGVSLPRGDLERLLS